MKILFFVDGSKNKYGSEKVAVDVIEKLSQKGIKFIVITAMPGYVRDYCLENGIETYLIKFYSFMYRNSRFKLLEMLKRFIQIIYGCGLDYISIKRITKRVDLNSIDIIYTNHARNLVGGVIAKKFHIYHIIHLHELINGHYYIYPLIPNQIKWVNNHTDCFISCANNVKKNWVKAGLDEHKVVNIYNGIEVDSIPAKHIYNGEDEPLKIVMVASVSKQKGQYILLKAIKKIDKNIRNNIIIDFYGEPDGEEDRILKKYAKDNNINANFVGYDTEIKQKLKNYDIGVNCSRAEACSISILEYKAAGLAVIATDTGGTSEIINDKVDGLLFNRKDINKLSEYIIRLYNNRQEIQKLGKNARNNVCELYSKDDFIDNIYQLFMEYQVC